MDMSNLPVVTPENYYDPEIQMAYMGATQYKAFQKCEAAALAELRGEYAQKSTQALLVGLSQPLVARIGIDVAVVVELEALVVGAYEEAVVEAALVDEGLVLDLALLGK